MVLYVYPARKDGKIPVSYCYPVAAKKINKILTPEQLAAELSAMQTRGEHARYVCKRGAR